MTNTQRTSAEVPKPFDYRLQTGERNAVVRRLREYNQSILAYRVDNLGDEATQRKYFEFAKAVNIPLIVTLRRTLPRLDKLADEFGINVALTERPRLPPSGPRQAHRHRRRSRRRASRNRPTA